MLNFSRHSVILGVVGLVLLSSCGTPEYRTEKSHCEAEWMLKMPPVYRQEIVTKYRTEERPTGEMICETTGATTNCKPVKETVSVPYTALETVDIKKAQRDPQIASCTARACVARYGNSACET
ncbi:hypothetical protein [Falsihalocynthiibacter arcticus]|uniref:Lipoprotein n=1 Tax=Falsihalocynthiibacter arcticus TaxID=1579316 RepID=A0A126V091_9RHOB|nr:hypothetical protein [Falsihalocynthiibacter arcticus]AML51704.1 hypothetical protein RC74_10915 [Falsihalocynthiibacter arcticus]